MSHRHFRSWLHRSQAILCASLACVGGASRAAAQATVTDPRDTTHAQTQAPFFTGKDAVLGVAFGVGTVLMFPLDRHIAQHIHQNPNSAEWLNSMSKGVETIASPGAYVIGGALYGIGLIGHWGRIEDLGWHGTESVLLADGITYMLKGLAGRSRPYVTSATQPHDFDFAQGFRNGDLQSFPSGHSTSAFAAAAAVTNETTRWWPHSTIIVGPLMYGGATAVALSRMYHNKHWASDVVAGAAIGTFTGRKVVQYQHGHPNNKLDLIMLHASVLPDGHGGYALAFSAPAPR